MKPTKGFFEMKINIDKPLPKLTERMREKTPLIKLEKKEAILQQILLKYRVSLRNTGKLIFK
jgi:hypothetical protein